MALHRLREPEIDSRDPRQGDLLERKAHGRVLGELIGTLTGSHVLAIKGAWGSGKSVFLRRLSIHLETTCRIPVISVDAWKSDYLPDPLISFVEAIASRLEDEGEAGNAKAADLFETATQIAVPVVATASLAIAPAAAPLVTAGASGIASLVKKWREHVKTRKTAEQAFAEQLSEARDILTGQESTRPIKPVVVLVDELDRCRPDYAIRLLERIKHYFDVPGVIFVIATDGDNLPASVATVYGSHIDGERYLRKFFDYEYRLPDPSTQAFCQLLALDFDTEGAFAQESTSKAQLQRLHGDPDSGDYAQLIANKSRALDAFEVLDSFPSIAASLGLSLRDQSQAFTAITAYQRSLGTSTVAFPLVVALGACLRYASERIYKEFRSGNFSLDAHFNSNDPKALINAPGVNLNALNPSIRVYISTFFAVAESDKPDEVWRGLRRRAEGELESRRNENYAALRRLEVRIGVARANSLKTYVNRAFMLVDAFSNASSAD